MMVMTRRSRGKERIRRYVEENMENVKGKVK